MGSIRVWILAFASVIPTFLMSSAARAEDQLTGDYAFSQPESRVGFTIFGKSFFKIQRDGEFKDFTGEVSYDPSHPANTHVDLTVFTASVDMHNPDNDQLLKSGAFFDVDRYPTMHFSSSSADVRPDGSFSLTGDMTIRGVTKRMTIPVRLRQGPPGGTPGAVFETNFQIDRTEFGLNGAANWGGFKVSISKSVQI